MSNRNETEHTPGPWDNDGAGVITGGTYLSTTIAETPKCKWITANKYGLADEAEANARLIAASPEMLEALENAEFLLRKLSVNWREAGGMLDSIRNSAASIRNVILKTKGR